MSLKDLHLFEVGICNLPGSCVGDAPFVILLKHRQRTNVWTSSRNTCSRKTQLWRCCLGWRSSIPELQGLTKSYLALVSLASQQLWHQAHGLGTGNQPLLISEDFCIWGREGGKKKKKGIEGDWHKGQVWSNGMKRRNWDVKFIDSKLEYHPEGLNSHLFLSSRDPVRSQTSHVNQALYGRHSLPCSECPRSNNHDQIWSVLLGGIQLAKIIGAVVLTNKVLLNSKYSCGRQDLGHRRLKLDIQISADIWNERLCGSVPYLHCGDGNSSSSWRLFEDKLINACEVFLCYRDEHHTKIKQPVEEIDNSVFKAGTEHV